MAVFFSRLMLLGGSRISIIVSGWKVVGSQAVGSLCGGGFKKPVETKM
jgi:hypothetical protein